MDMMKIILLIVIAAGLIASVVVWQGDRYKKFIADASKASGTLIKKEVRNFRPNQQTGKENWAVYTYVVDGKTYDGEEKVEYADLLHDLAEGQEVEVYYSMDNPKQSHLAVVLDRRLGLVVKLIDSVK
jgi:hypothetical protein